MMLIDEFLPEYDFNETHDIEIYSNKDRVIEVVDSVDFSESFLIRWMFRLRGLSAKGATLSSLQKSRFALLGERPGEELLLGLVGRFWTPLGDLKKIDAVSFKQFNESGYAKAVWNFSLAGETGKTHLCTETRVKCLDAASRLRFAAYWMIIRPFSGLIRSEMLRLIKQKAEAI